MDLTATNNNNPDRIRATNTPGDVENLIAGTFQRWWPNVYGERPTVMLGAMAYEFATPFLCFGGQPNEAEPRKSWNNTSSYTDARTASDPWLNFYSVISLTNDGLQALDRGMQIGPAGANNSRARAFAKFMQGVSHGYLALLYDKAVVIDEHANVDTLITPTYVPSKDVMAAAIAMLNESIAISDTANFTLPTVGWVPGLAISNKDLSRLAHTYIARFMAYEPRNPAERAAVDWTKVIQEVDSGITADFAPVGAPDILWDDYKRLAARVRTVSGDYMRGGYWLVGPADSTDGWKGWVATPVANRTAFKMQTKDRRIIGAGSSTAAGKYFNYNSSIGFFNPTRGTYLQTYYYFTRYGAGTSWENGPLVAIGRTELDLLKAEALIRLNRASEAVPLINKTRVANGQLANVTVDGPPDEAGCVPRKTTGGCGSLWDALRYEKRIEGAGVDGLVAYFDARGWGTLAENSFVELPIPARELEVQRLPLYTFGGAGGQSSAPAPQWDVCPTGVTGARCS